MFVIMGSNRWGKGETLAKAKEQFRWQGAKLSDGYGVFEFGPDSTFDGVDMMGRVQYRGTKPTFTEVPARKVNR